MSKRYTDPKAFGGLLGKILMGAVVFCIVSMMFAGVFKLIESWF